MARIAGVDLPKHKRIEIALTYIYGLGLSSSQKILNLDLGFNHFRGPSWTGLFGSQRRLLVAGFDFL